MFSWVLMGAIPTPPYINAHMDISTRIHMLDADAPTPQSLNMNSRTSPFIMTFASPKGGVGKSTSCLAIAGALTSLGYPVHIMDLDQTKTLWSWYSQHKPDIPNLTVEHVVETDFGPRLKTLYHERQGFILVDAAGALTDAMVHAATIAHLTITPTKLSKPDVEQATNLHYKILEVGKAVGKGITHRILVNEVASLLPSYQQYTLDQIETGPLKRFQTLMHVRAPYAEALLTGQPPHYADKSRPPVQKTIAEINALLAEVFEALAIDQQKAAA